MYSAYRGAWWATVHGFKESDTTDWLSTAHQYSAYKLNKQGDNIIIVLLYYYCSVQFSSVTQSCPTLCDPMNHSMPGLPVPHQLPEFTQTHVHRVGDAIQPSHPLWSPSPPAPNPSQHQGLFQWVNSSHEVAKVLEFQLQPQSFQWTPRTDILQDGLVGSCSPMDSQESSPIPQFKSINSSVLSFVLLCYCIIIVLLSRFWTHQLFHIWF